jgi:hypothetical protein
MSNTTNHCATSNEVQSQSSDNFGLSETEKAAFIVAASSSMFLDFVEQQLRAAEHHYLDGDGDSDSNHFDLGYLEAMQDMYSWFRHWHENTRPKSRVFDNDDATHGSDQHIDIDQSVG